MFATVFIHSFQQTFIEYSKFAKPYASSQRYMDPALNLFSGDTKKETGMDLSRCIKLTYSGFKDNTDYVLQLFLLFKTKATTILIQGYVAL